MQVQDYTWRMTYQLENVTICRNGQLVLKELSMTLPSARVTGLIGPNGVGKSTLLAALAGDLKIDQGQISLHHNRVDRLSPEALALGRAIMSQQASAIFNLTVRQVLELGLHAFAHWRSADRTALVNEVAHRTEVQAWLERSITMLSIGQQQRVHFARTLVQAIAAQKEHGRMWLLLDEPTANQDPWHQQMMMSVCHSLTTEHSAGVVMVMHDLTLAAQWCDDIVVLKDQGVIAHGPAKDVLTPKLVKHTYGDALDVEVLWSPLPGVILSKRQR